MSQKSTPDASWYRKGGARGYVTTAPVEWWINLLTKSTKDI